MADLSDKRILLVGTDEIASAILQALLESRADVTVIGRDKEKLEKLKEIHSENSVLTSFFDFYDIPVIANNISSVTAGKSSFNGFVFAAGYGDVRPLLLTGYQNMSAMMNANCFSFVEITRNLVKTKAIAEWGSVVAVSSISSFRAFKSKLAYAASKAALDASVRTIAAELGNKYIRVNSIQKGVVSSDFDLSHVNNIAQLGEKRLYEKQFLGVTDISEIAALVCFLLGDSVKTITGRSFVIDGGYTL